MAPFQPLQVFVDVPRDRQSAAAWALECLLARARVPNWELVSEAVDADLVLPSDPAQWEFAWDRAPDAERDPLAATFWWLARVEELLAPAEAFDEHGRFAYASSALARGDDPLATPIDDLARALDVAEWARPRDPAWSIVPSHDIDVPWRWTRRGRRRALRRMRDAWRAGHRAEALRVLAALTTEPMWRMRRGDPWSNAERIRRLEWRYEARSTSYLLVDHHVPSDGDPDVLERGARRYAEQLVAWTRRRRSSGGGLVGVHGSYTTSTHPQRLIHERDIVERWVGDRVADHRFHYLRHRPVQAWPQLAAVGMRTDSSLGYAEHPGFRAGTAHPFRAWDHERARPLDLVIIPLAFMDASLDERYLDTPPHGAGRALALDVLDRIRAVGGCASVLFHNDRLCTVDSRSWTRLYARMLARVRDHGGQCVTARDCRTAYLAALPPSRLHA